MNIGSAGFLFPGREGVAESPTGGGKNFSKKFKEGVDSLTSLYIFIRPSSDSGHSLGSVLRQSATAPEQVRAVTVAPSKPSRYAEAPRVDSPSVQPLVTIFDSAGPVSHSNGNRMDQ